MHIHTSTYTHAHTHIYLTTIIFTPAQCPYMCTHVCVHTQKYMNTPLTDVNFYILITLVLDLKHRGIKSLRSS